MSVPNLPAPSLSARAAGSLEIITDDALARTTGVRVVFSGTAGGVSEGPYASLNLATHVGDDPVRVAENRSRLLRALDAADVDLVVPNQVHGTSIVEIASPQADVLDLARAKAAEGADGIVVEAPDVAALLCFADCVPVVIVSPTGRFAVVHAGWRGTVGRIASKAVVLMAARDRDMLGGIEGAAASYNVYVGPHIMRECFETGPEVRARFVEAFGNSCAFGETRVSLAAALSSDLVQAGVDPARIAHAGVCTVCSEGAYYSYRASGGTCGRHGALAFRRG